MGTFSFGASSLWPLEELQFLALNQVVTEGL